jgi:predicted ATPase
MAQPLPWLRRVRIANYRSIASCDVTLSPLTLLIGPNGSGKSNFLDALRFLSDAIATTPYQAIEAHGGFGEILRRVPGPATSFSISADVALPYGPLPEQLVEGSYGFEIAKSERRGERPVEVVQESCELRFDTAVEGFRVERGDVTDARVTGPGKIERDRLYLPAASVRPNLGPLFRYLRGMQFYNLDASTLRQPRAEAEGAALGRHGEHLPDVLGGLSGDRAAKQRFDEYLAAVLPAIEGLDRRYVSSYVTVEMRQRSSTGAEVTFGPDGMSDGTIRAAGILAALFQPATRTEQISLIGIEEPELALHPSAAGVLFDALTEASEHVQIVASSQSADLLDRDDIDPTMIRAVTTRDGVTLIGELDDASQSILAEKQITLGELMRGNQLTPRDPV